MSRLADRLVHVGGEMMRRARARDCEGTRVEYASDDDWIAFWRLTFDALYEALPLGMLVVVNFVTCLSCGPSAILSVSLAALLGGFAGLALCEMRSRAAALRRGRSFECMYDMRGEVVAYLCGLAASLEAMLMTSLAMQAAVYYFDAMLGHALRGVGDTSDPVLTAMPLNLVAVLLIVAMSASLGAKTLFSVERHRLKGVVSCALLLFCLFLFLSCAWNRLHFENWNKPSDFFPKQPREVFSGAAALAFVFIRPAQRICSNSNFVLASSRRLTLICLGCVITVLLLCLSAMVGVITLLDGFHLSRMLLRPGSVCIEAVFTGARIGWMKYILGIVCTPVLILRACNSLREAVLYLETFSVNNMVCKIFSERITPGGLGALSIVIVAFISIVFVITGDGYFLAKTVSTSVLIQMILVVVSLIEFHYRSNKALETNNNRGLRRASETTGIQVDRHDQSMYGTAQSNGGSTGGSERTDGDAELLGRSDGSDAEENVDIAVLEYRLTTAAIKYSDNTRARHLPTESSRRCAMVLVTLTMTFMIGVAAIAVLWPGKLGSSEHVTVALFICCIVAVILLSFGLALKPTDRVTRHTLLISLPLPPFAHLLLLFILYSATLLIYDIWPVFAFILWLAVGITTYALYKMCFATNSDSYADFGRASVQISPSIDSIQNNSARRDPDRDPEEATFHLSISACSDLDDPDNFARQCDHNEATVV